MTNQISTSAPTGCNDITVNIKTGEAFISQRKLAELLNVSKSAISSYISRAVKEDTSQGLTAEIMQSCVQYYALDCANPTEEAKQLLRKIATAGTKAYLYQEAGLTMSAVQQQRPLTQLEAFKELVRLEEERIALLDTVSQQSGLLVQQKEVIDYKKIITGEGEEYFPVSLVSDHNEGRTFSGRRLAIYSAKAEIDPIPMFASKGQISVKAYHWSVWEAAYPSVVLPD